MADTIKVPASTQLRNVATQQEAILDAINKFKVGANEYGATNPEVINDVDMNDAYLIPLEAVNQYGPTNEYKSPE